MMWISFIACDILKVREETTAIFIGVEIGRVKVFLTGRKRSSSIYSRVRIIPGFFSAEFKKTKIPGTSRVLDPLFPRKAGLNCQ